MALNRDAIGKPIGPMKRDYTWKDAVLYALGVGAGFSELNYCYEKNLKVIPSFSIAMIFDLFFQAAIASGVNLAGILHGEQDLIFHHPIPTEGTLITIVFIANPNNPTGTWLSPAVLQHLFSNIRQDIIIVLDLAYTEYMDENIKPPIKQWLEKFPNLPVLLMFL